MRLLAAVLLIFVLIFMVTWAAQPVEAGKRPIPSCWWEGGTLYATDLPDEWSITADPRPNGVFPGPSSIVYDYGFTFTAYFWTRGGGKGLFRPGKQLNDYHPVCVAIP